MASLHKGGDGRIEDKIFMEDNVAGSCLRQSASLCQQDLRKHQNEAKRLRLELDKCIRRQAEIQEEYDAITREIAGYKHECQEQSAVEAKVHRDEMATCVDSIVESGVLAQQNKRVQEDIIDLETQLNCLDREKHKLVRCLTLLISQKPEAYVLLSGSREEQIATVAQYNQYLMDFVDTAREIERQQQVPVVAFLNQDISLLLEKVNILKQQQSDLKYPEIETINQVRELYLALEDMAQDYGWTTSQITTDTQSVTVNNQSVSQLRQQANDLLVVAPPGLLARVGLCEQWKKSLFDLIIRAKSMEELAYSPEALRRQIIAGVESVLLECHHLVQRIYEGCYKHLSACGHSLDQAYNKIQDEMTTLTKQLLNSSKQVPQSSRLNNTGAAEAEFSLQQRLEKIEDKAALANSKLEELAEENAAILLGIEEITKQLEDSISPDNETRISIVREWVSEIQQYQPETKKAITERAAAERGEPIHRRNCAECDSVAQKLVAKEPGLVLLEAREWLLPVAVMAVEYTLEGHRDHNLFEKYIMKCIASGLSELSSPEAIAGLLNLEAALVDKHVNKLVQCCLLIERQNGGDRKYELSALGWEVCQTGKVITTLLSGNAVVTVNAQYEWLDVWRQGVNSVGDTDCKLPLFRYYNKQEELALREYYPVDNQEVSHSVEEKIREWYLVRQQEPVIHVYEPQYQQDSKLRFAEIWLYDVAHNQIFCRVWNFAQQEFCTKLEFALSSLEGRQRHEQVQAACNNNAQWTAFITKLRNQDKPFSASVIEESPFGAYRSNAYRQAIDDTRELLFLLMPDLTEITAAAEIIKCLRNAVNRGCRIFIGWGTAYDIAVEQQLPPAEVLERLHSILDAEGFPGVFTMYIGNQESKTVLVDEQCLLTWLPCLSYQGKQLTQNQSVAKVIDKSCIREQQLLLQGLFLNQLERQLLQNQLADSVKCITWFYALLTLNEHSYIREVLADEALTKVMDSHSEQTLFKLLAVYVKANQYEFGLSLLLTRLAAKEDSYTKLTYWLDKLRTRNPKAYSKIIPIYKTIRKRK